MPVRAFQSAEVGALADTDAGDEKRHRALLREEVGAKRQQRGRCEQGNACDSDHGFPPMGMAFTLPFWLGE
jgi:hypothetical protein